MPSTSNIFAKYVTNDLARLLKSTGWLLCSRVAIGLSGLTMAVVGARVLGVSEFGKFGLVMTTYALFGQLGGFGLSPTATKFVAETQCDRSASAKVVCTINLLGYCSYGIVAFLVSFFSPSLASWMSFDQDGILAIHACAFMVFILGMDSIQTSTLAGLSAFRVIGLVNLVRSVLAPLLAVILTPIYGIYGLIASIVIASALATVLATICVKKILNIYNAKYTDWILARKMAAFALPAFLGWSVVVPSHWAAFVILANRDGGLIQVAFLSAAMQWRSLAILVPGMFNSVVLSHQSRLHAAGEKRRFKLLASQSLTIQIVLSGVVSTILFIGASLVMRIYGQEYGTESVQVLRILAVGWLVIPALWQFWNILLATNKVWLGFAFNSIGAIALVVGSWLLRDYGAKGIALSFTCAAIFQVLGKSSYSLNRRNIC